MVDQRSNEVKILTKQHFSWFFTKLERLKDFWPLWPSLTKFDQRLILGGPKNPNFDPTVRMGWNQCHCKDYQILISTTIHGSKSMLDWSRYHENRDNASINAHLTSKSHNFRSDRWIFKIHTFLEIGSQDLSRGSKIKPVWGGLKVAALEGPPPRKSCWGYKKPQAHTKKKKKKISLVLVLCLDVFYTFLLSLKQKTHKIHTSKPLDSSLHQNTRYCSCMFLNPLKHN